VVTVRKAKLQSVTFNSNVTCHKHLQSQMLHNCYATLNNGVVPNTI